MMGSVVEAKALKPKKRQLSTTTELTNFLTPDRAVGELESPTLVKVRIRVNSNREIIVLHTDTDNSELSNYIIEKLNYKKLLTDDIQLDKDYVFEVNFQS
ncbi:hypothetical protein FUMI01_32930 [Flavobacterium sp. UMI-01]|nr:hypothetical protein FUMI01_32930 [Flavobacterium sp. UMI-01]